ncbi:hypothetical protein AMS68_002668 [Peltaster fructicola]|uniref:Vacuolar protein sorting/targeting protein 10 n=1 Tax=Peltaster fructicola TaxID=286661 RepID=A0A6H0XR71_9PEZI|nr:hypothetical protein AMS68_002668 [Peltaster fructicola]
MRCLLQLPWVLASLVLQAVAKEKTEGPGVTTTSFTNTVIGLTYFEDSNTILFPDLDTNKVWQSTDGGNEWETIADVEDAVIVEKHPVDRNVAVILTGNTKHYITKDQGKTWTSFKLPSEVNYMGRAISFHAGDSDRILIQGVECESIFCEYPVYYTTDGFDSVMLLHENVRSCLWAKSTEQFSTGDEDQDKNRILCNIEGEYSFFLSDSQIFITDDFFETKSEPYLDGDRAVNGIIEIASVTGYLAAAAKSSGSNELALYTTTDTKHWERATFGNHTVREKAYTILESTNYSMQVDVLAYAEPPMGVLFTSNSNGTFFTKSTDYYTNRDSNGFVDFEKVANIPGIVLVNKVSNAEDVLDGEEVEKKMVTEISFDDGRTWHSLKQGRDNLHLHSVTDQRNIGRVFSSPAPGIVMGNGNTGKYLKGHLKDSDTFVSADAGLTWFHALDGPHMYEMGGSGTILVAISSTVDKATDEIKWSTDYGRNWTTTKLENKVRVTALTTTPDSTSLKFIVTAAKAKEDREGAYEIIALDFSKLDLNKCSKDDFEDWPARVDEDGNPACLMGHTRIFRRRKADAECIIDDEFHDIEPELENCKCKDEDYECDFGFVSRPGTNSTTECHPVEPLVAPKGACQDDDDTYEGPSGYRLIPGNTCEQRGGIIKDKPVERKCKETAAPPSGSVNSTTTTAIFKGHGEFVQRVYLERCEKCAGNDETIVALTKEGAVFVTHDHGKSWQEPHALKDKIIAIHPHRYFTDRVFFLTSKKHVYVSEDRVQTISSMDTPEALDPRKPMSFHPKEPEWLIFTGDEDNGGVAHYTTGGKWKKLLGGARKCEFVYSELRKNETDLVYCEQYADEKHGKGELVLRGSKNWFEDDDEPLRHNVVSFATMAEYIVVALFDDDKT